MKKNFLFARTTLLYSCGKSLKMKEKIWVPLADLYRAPWGWLLKLELSGVRKEDIQILVKDKSIKVIGRRTDLMERLNCELECYFMEIPYCRFQRTFSFPIDLNTFDISSQLEEGFLWIKIKSNTGAS